MRSDAPFLEVKHLTIAFGKEEESSLALDNISFTLKKGETLGIVGESGSGKSLTSLAVIGLLPLSAKIRAGEILLGNDRGTRDDILQTEESELQKLRGSRIAMIFQEPMTSLNPVQTCGAQVLEAIRQHRKMTLSEARNRTIALFMEVELPRPEAIFDTYPHQISGGQKQRVMIAMAMSCEPDLLIADEPTTALDVTVQRRILELLNRLKEKNNMAVIFITHDLGVVAEVADRVMVMYRGKVLEEGDVRSVFEQPANPYTKALIACRPRLDSKPKRLPTVSDFLSESEVPFKNSEEQEPFQPNAREKPLIKVEHLNVVFPTKRDWMGKPVAFVHAVNNVNFEVRKGETLGLVGESGCGKSTLGRAILRLIPVQSGEVRFGACLSGRSESVLTDMNEREMRPLRKEMQLIFQDPYASLNPRRTVAQTLMEPLLVHKLLPEGGARQKRIANMLDRVGLPEAALRKYPHEFSGGQRQRICIARALMVEPKFLVCDESVSALDVSVQAQVLNLLNELKADFGLTYIFISHDLSVVKYMSDRMIVMKKGSIVEMGDAADMYAAPKSDYTRELIAAIPAF